MKNGNYGYVSIFFAHGLTSALTIYLAVRGGDWIDERLGTSPLFLILFVLLLVAANIRLLIKDVIAEADREDREDRRARGGSPRGEGQGRNDGQTRGEAEDREEEDG